MNQKPVLKKVFVMQKEIVYRVFSTVQSLEQQVENLKNQLGLNPKTNEKHLSQIAEFEAVIKSMRRTANKLQIEAAKKDASPSVRLLKIFYGLNYMVRPEVLKASMSLFSDSPIQISNAAQNDSMFH